MVIIMITVNFNVDEHHLIGKLPLMYLRLQQMKPFNMLPLNAMI